MSIITIVRHSLKQAARSLKASAINRREADLDWQRESAECADMRLANQAAELNELRRRLDPRSSDEIVRDISRREKGFA